ncbi:MAG: PIG-L deacetylase family protein [Ilumatobacteraceae bacterium]
MTANDPGQPGSDGRVTSRDLPTPGVALAVGAHPDDIEFGAGGTLAKWAAAGCTVHFIVCTDGSKGTWDVTADTAELAARRDVEQVEAARRLRQEGPGEVVFLGQVDGELDNLRTVRSRLAREIRRLRPDIVLGHDPWKRYRLHPDHRAAGLLLCDAVVAARDPHFFPEHELEHHRPSRMLLWEADEPDHVEDVSAWTDTKLGALEAHVSQFESTMKAVDEIQLDAFRTRIRERLASIGAPHGLAAAEQFKLIADL